MIAALIASSFYACRKSVDPSQFGKMQVDMTDDSAAYQEVNVEIRQVQIHVVPNNGGESWINLPTHSGVYNLLSLKNMSTVLVDPVNLPIGKVTQLWLMLGEQNTIKVNDKVYPLTIPGENEKEPGVDSVDEIKSEQTVKVLIDFDANSSVLQEGNGTYKLKPVLHVKH